MSDRHTHDSHQHSTHSHPHPYEAGHTGHPHLEHEHDHGWLSSLLEAIPFLPGHHHDHSHAEANVDDALEGSARGL